jgi:hypothetical protein
MRFAFNNKSHSGAMEQLRILKKRCAAAKSDNYVPI